MISGYSGKTKPKPGAQIDPAHPLSRGLVGCWLFNEGTGSRVNDISGHGNHGTLTNMDANAQGSGWSGSRSGGGMSFDGTNDYVNCGHDSSLDITDSVSVVAWVRPTTLTGNTFIVTNSVFGHTFALYTAGNEIAGGFYSGAAWFEKQTTGTININTYHQLAYVFDDLDEEIRMYIDESPPEILTNVTGTPESNPTQDLLIGEFTGQLSTYVFNGLIDYIAIYNRAISTPEIKQIYHNPFCNILKPRRWYVPSAGPTGVIINQFQKSNLGADLFNGALQ